MPAVISAAAALQSLPQQTQQEFADIDKVGLRRGHGSAVLRAAVGSITAHVKHESENIPPSGWTIAFFRAFS